VFEVVSAFAFFSLFQIFDKKDLHRRSAKRLRLLRKLVLFIGKLLRIRAKIRYSKGMRVRKT